MGDGLSCYVLVHLCICISAALCLARLFLQLYAFARLFLLLYDFARLSLQLYAFARSYLTVITLELAMHSSVTSLPMPGRSGIS